MHLALDLTKRYITRSGATAKFVAKFTDCYGNAHYLFRVGTRNYDYNYLGMYNQPDLSEHPLDLVTMED